MGTQISSPILDHTETKQLPELLPLVLFSSSQCYELVCEFLAYQDVQQLLLNYGIFQERPGNVHQEQLADNSFQKGS